MVSIVKKYREQAGLSQKGLEAKTGVHQPLISEVESQSKGLSEAAAIKVGEALGVDPLALFLESQSAAIKARVDRGELEHRDALQGMARVACTVKEMMERGEVQGSDELVAAAQKMAEVHRALEDALAGFDDGSADDRDIMGRRVDKAAAAPSEGAYPLWEGHRRGTPDLEALEDAADEDYDDLEAEGRDPATGIRVRPMGGDE